MNYLKQAADIVKDRAQYAVSRTPLEKALHNCLSNMETISSTTEMSFIADQTNY